MTRRAQAQLPWAGSARTAPVIPGPFHCACIANQEQDFLTQLIGFELVPVPPPPVAVSVTV